MKRSELIFGFIVFVALNFVSCGPSKSSLESDIKVSFQEKLDTDSDYKKYGMQTQKATLMKSGSNTYDGFATVLLGGNTHDVAISVTVDGTDYMWQTKPMAFAFLIQKELEDLGKELENLEKLEE